MNPQTGQMTGSIPTVFDQAKAEQFSEKMLNVINYSGLSLMFSLGHRTHLFEVMANMEPATSHEIATQAELNERYVREWLNSLAVGGVIEYEPEAKTYFLPREHARFLTSQTNENMAATLQFIPVLASVEDQILHCFQNGGGVPYTEYKRFHEVMAEESAQTVIGGLMDYILPLVPGIKEKMAQGIRVLDIGCGRGRAMVFLARQFPRSTFTGYDFSTEAVESGMVEAKSCGATNVQLIQKDVAQIDEVEQYDLITAFDAIHDQAHPQQVLDNIRRALKTGGTFLMQDIRAHTHVHGNYDNLLGPFTYAISCMHCMSVSLSNGGAGLGAAWGEEMAMEMLRKAGFTDTVVETLPHDIMNNYYISTKK